MKLNKIKYNPHFNNHMNLGNASLDAKAHLTTHSRCLALGKGSHHCGYLGH